jgi:hypothetical protein
MAKIQLQDLTPGKSYKLQLRSVTGSGEYSDWSQTITFTVPANIDTSGTYAVAPITKMTYRTIVGDSSSVKQSGLIQSAGFNGALLNNNNLDMTPANAGNAGWAIDYSGNAIFNNILARGTIESSSGTIGGFNIGSSSIFSTNGILSLNADSSGYITKTVSVSAGSSTVTITGGGITGITEDMLPIIFGATTYFNAGARLVSIGPSAILMSEVAKNSGTGLTMYFYKSMIKSYDFYNSTDGFKVYGNGTIAVNDITALPGTAQIGINGDTEFFGKMYQNGNMYITGQINQYGSGNAVDLDGDLIARRTYRQYWSGTSAALFQNTAASTTTLRINTTDQVVAIGGSTRNVYSAEVLGSVGYTGSLVNTSSREFKTDIQELVVPDSILNISPVTFKYDESKIDLPQSDIGKTQIGLIAEEFSESGLPEVVIYDEDGVTVRGLDYSKIGMLLLPIVKRQKERIDSLEERIATLENK